MYFRYDEEDGRLMGNCGMLCIEVKCRIMKRDYIKHAKLATLTQKVCHPKLEISLTAPSKQKSASNNLAFANGNMPGPANIMADPGISLFKTTNPIQCNLLSWHIPSQNDKPSGKIHVLISLFSEGVILKTCHLDTRNPPGLHRKFATMML